MAQWDGLAKEAGEKFLEIVVNKLGLSARIATCSRVVEPSLA